MGTDTYQKKPISVSSRAEALQFIQ
jgi:hypothetical protein